MFALDSGGSSTTGWSEGMSQDLTGFWGEDESSGGEEEDTAASESADSDTATFGATTANTADWRGTLSRYRGSDLSIVNGLRALKQLNFLRDNADEVHEGTEPETMDTDSSIASLGDLGDLAAAARSLDANVLDSSDELISLTAAAQNVDLTILNSVTAEASEVERKETVRSAFGLPQPFEEGQQSMQEELNQLREAFDKLASMVLPTLNELRRNQSLMEQELHMLKQRQLLQQQGVTAQNAPEKEKQGASHAKLNIFRKIRRGSKPPPPAVHQQKPRSQSVGRKRALELFLEDEAKYCGNLSLLVGLFVLPLKEEAKIDAMRCRLSPQDARIVFQNLEQIWTMHMNFLNQLGQLKNRFDDHTSIGGFLLSFVDEFMLYVPYINGYSEAVQRLHAMKKSGKDHAKFKKFCRNAETHEDMVKRKTTMLSLLALPLTRPSRYPTMIQQIIGSTDESHPDYETLLESLSKFASALTQSN